MIKNLKHLSRFLRYKFDITCSLPNRDNEVIIVGINTKGKFNTITNILQLEIKKNKIEINLPITKKELEEKIKSTQSEEKML